MEFLFCILINLLPCHNAITWCGKMAATYKSDLLGHLDLGDNSSSYIICEASCVTDAEGVWT